MEQAQATFNECKKNLDENESLVASLDSVITKVKRFYLREKIANGLKEKIAITNF